MADNEEKKIIVDEDWKVQAQKEKEKLAAEQQEKEVVEEAEAGPLPDADFSGLVSLLATQAYFALGLIQTEEGQPKKADLKLAKFNIDMLGVIEEKTKGNISEQEAQMLEGALHQLRMVFVKLSE